MAVAGAPFAIAFNAVTFLVGAVTVLAAPRRQAAPVEQLSARAVLREIASGFAYARRSVEVRIILLLVGAATLSYSGLFGVGLPTLSHYLIAVVLLAVLGFGVAYPTDVALPTFVQSTAPETMLGRVNSLIDLPRADLSPLSLAVFGFLAAAGIRWAFLAAAVPMLLVGIGLALSGHATTLTGRGIVEGRR